MRDNFERALAFTLSWEGTFSNDPDDPGGETWYGINARDFPTDVEYIKNLPEEERMDYVRSFYLMNFWIRASCDNHDFPMDIICFDTAVNMGIGRAYSLYDASEDWKEMLLNRCGKYSDIALKMKTSKFLRGWLNRVYSLYKLCKREGA